MWAGPVNSQIPQIAVFLALAALTKGTLAAMSTYEIDPLLQQILHQSWSDHEHRRWFWDRLQSNVSSPAIGWTYTDGNHIG